MVRIPTAPLNGPLQIAGAVAKHLHRHPVAIRTHFDHSLVLTWAFRPEVLAEYLVDGLTLDTYTGADGVAWGFAAVAVVKLNRLRPAFAPLSIGFSDVMVGYRVFCTMQVPRGRRRGPGSGPTTEGKAQDHQLTLRGLRIVGSRTTNRLLQFGANASTRYSYGRMSSRVEQVGQVLEVQLRTEDHSADLTARAYLDRPDLPAGSVFADAREARRFAGPLPYTFSPDPDGIVVVEADHNRWVPAPVAVEVDEATFFDHGPFAGAERRLSNAFYLTDVDYGWRPGRLYRVGNTSAPWQTTVVR